MIINDDDDLESATEESVIQEPAQTDPWAVERRKLCCFRVSAVWCTLSDRGGSASTRIRRERLPHTKRYQPKTTWQYLQFEERDNFEFT